MGDDSRITKIDARYHKFNYMGDVTWVKGKVADKIDKGQLPKGELLQKMLKRAVIDLAPLWLRLREICLKLETLAHKQLRGVPFSRRENAFIRGYGEMIAGIMLYGGISYVTPNDDAPRIVDDGGAVVPAFLDIGRIGALHQRHVHFVDDAGQRIAQQFDIDGRKRHGDVSRAREMMRFPSLSTTQVSPGNSGVVVSSCSTMAGPVNFCPGASESRW